MKLHSAPPFWRPPRWAQEGGLERSGFDTEKTRVCSDSRYVPLCCNKHFRNGITPRGKLSKSPLNMRPQRLRSGGCVCIAGCAASDCLLPWGGGQITRPLSRILRVYKSSAVHIPKFLPSSVFTVPLWYPNFPFSTLRPHAATMGCISSKQVQEPVTKQASTPGG